MKPEECFRHLKRLKAISETGLIYAVNDYDKERYAALKSIALLLIAGMAQQPYEHFREFFMPQKDYPTPKVDVRGPVMNEKDEILLVREQIDGRWTIPGGWCDIGFTPSEVIEKEMLEETGLQVAIVRLLALYDKRCHPHPPQPFYVYKLNFLCNVTGGEISPNFDIMEVGYFSLENLPPLSEDRILKSQLEHLVQLAKSPEKGVYVD